MGLRIQDLFITAGHANEFGLGRKESRHRIDSCLRRGGLARALWQSARAAEGTVVASYLANRAIGGPIPATLRYLPSALHTPTRSRHPAMIAAVSRWPERKIVSVHRTYLSQDGSSKISINPARMALGSIKGGAVRLAGQVNGFV